MWGITRENVSGNALGVGALVGAIIGGVAAPLLISHSNQDQSNQHSTFNAFQLIDTDVPLSNQTSSTKGFLALYAQNLRSLTSATASPFVTWQLLMITFVFLLILKLLYNWAVRPFEYVRGYDKEKRLEASFLRCAGAIPPGYPNCWFKIADERDIPTSYEKGFFRIDALGEVLIIFRLPKVHPFELEGLKEGEIVVFTEATLNGINLMDPKQLNAYNKKDFPKVYKWISREINRMVFIWHHLDNHESDMPPVIPTEPEWEIPLIPSMTEWSYHGSVTHEIACHVQEIPENGADLAHLEYIHGDFLLTWLGKIVRHSWNASWEPLQEPIAHVARLALEQNLTVFGYRVPGTRVYSDIDQVGPACVQLIFPTPFGKVCVVETVTPIRHTLQRAQNVLYAERTVPRFLSKLFLMGLVVQFERDLPIWNNKHFLRAPLIIKEDGPILKYRRWMRKFFSNKEYQAEVKRNEATLNRYANEE